MTASINLSDEEQSLDQPLNEIETRAAQPDKDRTKRLDETRREQPEGVGEEPRANEARGDKYGGDGTD